MSLANAREELLERRRRLRGVVEIGMRAPQIEGLLREVDLALDRIEQGTYGFCETCGDSIEDERLSADPLVRFCLDHLTRSQARALEQDLELAGRVQLGLLPPKLMVDQGWEIGHQYRPHGPVSGDYCDVVRPPAPDGGLLFLFGDISGKGVAASMLMAHLHATARTLVGLDLPLAQIVERANRVFCDSTMQNHYATLVCGRLTSSGSVELCNAGHCPPLLLRAGTISPIEATAIPIGLFCGGTYGVRFLQLDPGDSLVLYTDGVTESVNVDGEPYGDGRIAEFLASWRGESCSELAAACMQHLEAFRGRAGRTDDETVMVIRRVAGTEARGH